MEDGGEGDGGRAAGVQPDDGDAVGADPALPALEPVHRAAARPLALHTPPTGTTFIPMAAERTNNATLNPLLAATSAERVDGGDDGGLEMSVNFL